MIEYRFVSEPEDAVVDQLIALYRQAGWWGELPDEREHVRGLVKGSHCVIVAFDGALVVGMGRAFSDKVSDAYIQDVTVDAAHRGQGIASSILERLIARLTQDGLGWIGLIAERNTQRLYEKLGFAPMENATPLLLSRKLPSE